ncbi:hypothetical protein BB560_004763, partial [Smittium megazygosporum]
MSTTDPSAAKPDDFAIGSISKRDRSGSGDEAAPVYPVKHPTMSYAGAAKGRPAAQSSNLFNYYSTSKLLGGSLKKPGRYLHRDKVFTNPLEPMPGGYGVHRGTEG